MNRSQPSGAAVLLALSIVVLLITSCARTPPAPIATRPDAAAYAKEIEQYRTERIKNLTSDNGWLTLIGLFWLKEGENKFGSDIKNEIVLPKNKVSPVTGSFWLKDGAVRLEAPAASGITVDGKPVTTLELKSDADETPTALHLGTVTIQILKRGDKLGVRVKDKENPDRTNFRGIDSYPTDLKWRVEARFEPYTPPKAMPITNVLGMESDEPSPGTVVFQVDGQTYRLDAITEPDEPKLFMIFAAAKRLTAPAVISISSRPILPATSSSTSIRPTALPAHSRITLPVRCRRNRIGCLSQLKRVKSSAAIRTDYGCGKPLKRFHATWLS